MVFMLSVIVDFVRKLMLMKMEVDNPNSLGNHNICVRICFFSIHVGRKWTGKRKKNHLTNEMDSVWRWKNIFRVERYWLNNCPSVVNAIPQILYAIYLHHHLAENGIKSKSVYIEFMCFWCYFLLLFFITLHMWLIELQIATAITCELVTLDVILIFYSSLGKIYSFGVIHNVELLH